MGSRRLGRVLVVGGTSLVTAAALALAVGGGRSEHEARGSRPSTSDLDGNSPLALQIPAIGVNARVEPVGQQPSGKVQTPVDYDAVGWYAFGPPPGEVGSSVMLGHVDSRTGPAVFFRLRDLAAGDDVVIRRVDGVAVRFVVDRLGQYERGRFPTVDVYGPEERSELRLVTCAGPYKGHYRDNLVVFLHRLP